MRNLYLKKNYIIINFGFKKRSILYIKYDSLKEEIG